MHNRIRLLDFETALIPEGSCEMAGIPVIFDWNSSYSILEVDIGSNPDLMMSGHWNRSSESML